MIKSFLKSAILKRFSEINLDMHVQENGYEEISAVLHSVNKPRKMKRKFFISFPTAV